MRISQLAILGALLIGALASCKQQNIDAGSNAAATYAANVADINSYTISQMMSGTTSSSGLFFQSTKPGSTTIVPAYGQEIEFTYQLSVLYGPSNVSSLTTVTSRVVDSKYANTSTFFPFFAGSLKSGLEEGILKMHEGESAILIMPSILAFGSVATDSVPANSPVRFDVTLKRTRTEDQQITDYIAANNLTVTKTLANGVRIIKTKTNSSGATPSAGQTITLSYAGKLLRATTGFSGGTGTDTKTVGTTTKFVAGFEAGLSELKVGEKATVIFPSSMGYGATGAAQNGSSVYTIPPYSPLSFDIEVLSAK